MSIKIFVILELNNFSCCSNVLLTTILKDRVAISQSMIRFEKYMRIAHLWLTSDILYCSWCRCKYGSISGLFSWIFCTTISHDKFDCSPYGAGYKSTGGKFWEFFLSLYSRDTWCIEVQNIFCFPITVPLASYGFHCCSKVAFRLMTPLHNGLGYNKPTRSDSTVYQYVC